MLIQSNNDVVQDKPIAHSNNDHVIQDQPIHIQFKVNELNERPVTLSTNSFPAAIEKEEKLPFDWHSLVHDENVFEKPHDKFVSKIKSRLAYKPP